MTAPCFVATSGVLPNSPTYNNGSSGVGATLTAGSNSTLVVQGRTLSVNQRILVKDQASDFQNGIYYVSAAGSGSTPWVLTRATDFDTPTKMMAADLIPIIAGADYTAVTTWLLDTTVNTIGTDSIDFEAYSVSPAVGAGAIYVGASGSGLATAVVPTGDVTISNAGVTTVKAISGTGIGLPGSTTAVTQSSGDNSTKLATTAYVDRGASGASEILLSTQTASSSSAITFTNIPSGYDHYILRITGVVPATGGTTLNMVFSTNNGSSYASTGYYNTMTILENNGTTSNQTVVGGSAFVMTGGVATSYFGAYGTITLMLNQTFAAGFVSQLGFSDNSDLARPAILSGSGELSTVTGVNAIKLLMSSGNITSGTFSLYAIRNQ
jgi:hypothetical protein